MIGHLLAGLLLAWAAPETRRLPPVDQCAADASFAQFRAELLDAIARRDVDHLLAVATDDVAISFGGYEGRSGMTELWGLDAPERSEIWDALAATLALGCIVDPDGARISPSFFLQTEDGDDLFETWLAVVPGAPLRAAPSSDAEVVARLDWDVLTWLGERDGWYEMRLADGRRGFVEAAHVRSLVDYRAIFERVGGRWRMTAFIAGD